MHQVEIETEYYNNGNGWRVAFYFQGYRRILTVEQASRLRDSLAWALDKINKKCKGEDE
uniref:Uncharacterized protein n=1 Tax=viral metagenome TaxID=1070528 RepID=A0A6M3J981_9ZZZZ